MAGFTLRPAGPEDVATVTALVESAYRGDASRAGWTTEADLLDGQRTDAAAVSAQIADPDTTVLLAEVDDEVLACCELRRPGDPGARGYFGMFAVRPGHQGGGLGRQVLAAAEEHAREVLGVSGLEMTVIAQRPELIAWYERRGYARTGQTRPFPHGDVRFGVPRRADLEFVVLVKDWS